MIYADGPDAVLVGQLAEKSGCDEETALRRALALYSWFLDTRASDGTLLARLPSGAIVEPIFNLVSPGESESKGSL
jgi:hypothetical protein